MGYQVGVTPLQMVAAVSSVANGGEYVEPRVIRAVYRDNRRYAVQPKIVRRTISADTAATHDRRSWKASSSAAPRRRAQIPGYTIAGKTGTAAKLVNGHYSHVRLQRVVCRLPAVARSGRRDHRRHRFAARPNGTHRRRGVGADLQADRRGDAALSRHRPDDQPAAAGARRAAATTGAIARRRTAIARPRPVVSLVADGPPGTVPDLRGLSARDAVRTLVKLGMNARVSGDGFVVSQAPAAGAPLDGDAVCRLVLERWPLAARGDCEPSMTWAELHGALRGRGLIRADDALRARGRRSAS